MTPSPYAEYRRDGMNKLLDIARTLCAIVQTFGAIIRSKYADYPNIIALLTAIDAVCALIPDAQADFDAIGFDDPAFPADPQAIEGIDPSAPAPPDIETGV